MEATLHLRVNGQSHRLTVDPATPLLYVLRNHLQLNGPKYGCGLQQCGACMVLLDGKAQPSCLIAVETVQKQEITTLEGIAQGTQLHPVQQAFIDEQAAQCGYCLNGMILSAVSLLNENPKPDEAAIREGLERVLCRCGTQSRILRAVKRASH
ncbi:(2Fe-2S)-binding protein [Siphonobacter curvatus]|uniref:(2Fe-2S)-binding protein n=1 Tax=Siphonobacter curvatus TaxID=2094562 RepID=A0A2S7II02_9BACT|nr:(2Fe-2S)-binding protein [Siphonobacter curvatus]PQA55708.1 (2Fe-2S)-binding protein [Siphonobacter curvatus]